MSDRGKEFFVGYLPMPAGLNRFYKALTIALLLIAAGFAYWTSSSQQSAGEGQWHLSGTETVNGWLSLSPYPVLHTTGPNPRSIMLVMQGKQAATAFVESLEGQHVELSGFLIERGGWSLMEMRGAGDVQASTAPAGVKAPVSKQLESIELSGEIVDSKCFMGVMKPGAGKVHRACAAMCIAGGIPPVLVVEKTDGKRFGYVLVNENGESAAAQVRENIAVPVRVTGSLEQRGDLTYLYLAPESVQAL
ncbi:MAG: hypothetical protein AB8B86_05345 [Pseudomonadales bacterium]